MVHVYVLRGAMLLLLCQLLIGGYSICTLVDLLRSLQCVSTGSYMLACCSACRIDFISESHADCFTCSFLLYRFVISWFIDVFSDVLRCLFCICFCRSIVFSCLQQ